MIACLESPCRLLFCFLHLVDAELQEVVYLGVVGGLGGAHGVDDVGYLLGDIHCLCGVELAIIEPFDCLLYGKAEGFVEFAVMFAEESVAGICYGFFYFS